MPKVDVITGEKRHRRWTIEEKQKVVGAAFAPGVRPTDIAKRAVISTGRPCARRDQLEVRRSLLPQPRIASLAIIRKRSSGGASTPPLR